MLPSTPTDAADRAARRHISSYPTRRLHASGSAPARQPSQTLLDAVVRAALLGTLLLLTISIAPGALTISRAQADNPPVVLTASATTVAPGQSFTVSGSGFGIS